MTNERALSSRLRKSVVAVMATAALVLAVSGPVSAHDPIFLDETQTTPDSGPFSRTSYVTLAERRNPGQAGRYRGVVTGGAAVRSTVAIGETEIFLNRAAVPLYVRLRSRDRRSNRIRRRGRCRGSRSRPARHRCGERAGPPERRRYAPPIGRARVPTPQNCRSEVPTAGAIRQLGP